MYFLASQLYTCMLRKYTLLYRAILECLILEIEQNIVKCNFHWVD